MVAQLASIGAKFPPPSRAVMDSLRRLNNGWSTTQSYCTIDARHDTIYALSTAPGRSAIAIIRLSGPAALDALQSLRPRSMPPPAARAATLTRLIHPITKDVLDKALCINLPAPTTVTGEGMVELHVHGAPTVIQAIMNALGCLSGLRPAEPGEFSRRAFYNGRMDLTEIEGLADLMAAETEAQRLQAVAIAGGATRRRCERWRSALLKSLARVEAVIDFGEDEGIADDVARGVHPEILALRRDLEAHAAASSRGELIRRGIRIALLGAPNAGKSSLCNALAGREIAIVSSIPGTTRDVIEVSLDLGGHKVVVSDVAGLRNLTSCDGDPIEIEGMRRALKTAEEADILLHVREPGGSWIDAHDSGISVHEPSRAISKYGRGVNDVSDNAGAGRAPIPRTLRVLNKIDLVVSSKDGRDDGGSFPGSGEVGGVADCAISCATGEGLDELIARLRGMVEAILRDNSMISQRERENLVPIVNRSRHKRHVEECIAALKRYEEMPMALDIAAEELRAAADALGRITGAIDTESVLDSIFSEFCIGK